MYIEIKSRTIVKTISWRILATFTTGLLVFIFVGRVDIAAAVGGLEMVSKLILYYLHERVWNKISFGKKPIDPFVLWFTGLPGSGKSTLANELYNYIKSKGLRVERLDGDSVRNIFPKTGFTREERDIHVRRVGYLASMLEKNGVFVISSFISPYREARNDIRKMCNNFIEVYVDTSLEECERRDKKGLYKRAHDGDLENFTGVSDPYEVPEKPEIRVKTDGKDIDETVKYVINQLHKQKFVNLNG